MLHLIETLGQGGAERNLVNVLKALPRGEHAVCYLYPPDDYAQDLMAAGIPVRCLRMNGRLDAARVIGELERELRRGDYQLLFTQIWVADILGRVAGALAQVPVLSAVQTSAYEPETLATYSRAGRWKSRFLLQTLDALTARLFLKRFVAASQFSGAQISKRLRVPQERVLTVPNSVDLDRFRPVDAASRRAVRAGLGIGPDEQVLLSVGKLNKGKGNDLLIRAMPSVLRRAPGARLWLLGVGPDREVLGRLAARCGVADMVRFIGQQRDVERYLWAADLFVFASRFEGMPLAVLEAMACGVPCVLSDIPPHREVSNAGEVARLARPDPAAWAEAINELLHQPARARAQAAAAQRRTAERYNARAVAEALDAVFQGEARASRWQRTAGLGDWLAAARIWGP